MPFKRHSPSSCDVRLSTVLDRERTVYYVPFAIEAIFYQSDTDLRRYHRPALACPEWI